MCTKSDGSSSHVLRGRQRTPAPGHAVGPDADAHAGVVGGATGDDSPKPDMVAECVKARLFEYADGSEDVRRMVAERRPDDLVRTLVSSCYDKAAGCGPAEMVLGVLATGILHYGLTKFMIGSQRRITHRSGVELDIVIPDVRTLDADAGRALVICILDAADADLAGSRIREIDAIGAKNIWLVVPKTAGADRGPDDRACDAAAGIDDSLLDGKRMFVISGNGGSFVHILTEIRLFADSGPASRLRIVGI